MVGIRRVIESWGVPFIGSKPSTCGAIRVKRPGSSSALKLSRDLTRHSAATDSNIPHCPHYLPRCYAGTESP